MRTKLIQLLDYNIIVSDEDLGINKQFRGYCWNLWDKVHYFNNGINEDARGRNSIQKIIASDNPEHNLPSIDYNGFEEKFGIIDIVSLSSQATKNIGFAGGKHEQVVAEMFYRRGFKKAQFLTDKKFSFNDVEKKLLLLSETEEEEKYLIKAFKRYNSLQQPKVVDIEIEMDSIWVNTNKVKSGEILGYYNHIPKITNNKVKIIKVIS